MLLKLGGRFPLVQREDRRLTVTHARAPEAGHGRARVLVGGRQQDGSRSTGSFADGLLTGRLYRFSPARHPYEHPHSISHASRSESQWMT